MQTETTTEKPIGTVTYLEQPINIGAKQYEALVMLPRGEFYAGRRTFAVVSTFPELSPARRNTLHGDWTTIEQARRFASSMGRGDKAFAVEVEPYLYAPPSAASTPSPERSLLDARSWVGRSPGRRGLHRARGGRWGPRPVPANRTRARDVSENKSTDGRRWCLRSGRSGLILKE